jgi:nucleotide-binding universal stress UspA family protein
MGALTRILLGTYAESIIRHAPCPVFVVRTDA